MAKLQIPPSAIFFVGLLHRRDSARQPCMDALSALFGPVADESNPYAMATFSTYYEKEMGSALSKQFVAFSRPVPMDELADCKLATAEVENRLRTDPERRLFNIDPGLVTDYSVVLSTSKNHAHRIYLRDGVFAEVTLIFRHGKLESLPWTYPDYRATPALDFFYRVRSLRKKSPGDA
jgi:hypothetical protein